jgi:histidinol-phosphatase (PHP family)
MIYKTDYHIHSFYSDGRSKPEDYISKGLELSLSEIGFSDHLSLFNAQEPGNMEPGNVLKYINHISGLREKETSIKIRTGLEVDFFPGKEMEIKSFLNKLPLDYTIGSVHFLGEKSVDMGTELYIGQNIEKLFESYFNSVCEAVESEIFDIIGHCDLIRIHGYKPVSDIDNLYRKLAKTMRKHDVVFELNTNGRNRPIADFYPDRRYLRIFKEESVPVCVNSDAHMPGRVGQYFEEAYDLLRYTGYTEMAIFENRIRKMVPF